MKVVNEYEDEFDELLGRFLKLLKNTDQTFIDDLCISKEDAIELIREHLYSLERHFYGGICEESMEEERE